MFLRVAHTIADTEAEGPGRRFAVWVQGCSLRCPGCCNPELFSSRGGVEVTPGALAADILKTPGIEGISVLGGEPFEQAAAVAELCRLCKARGLSVMVYTGFTMAELQARPDAEALIAQCDLMLDGRYVREAPEPRRRWVGSTNQVLHFLTDRYQANDGCFEAANTAEVRLVNGKLVVNGWPALADALRSIL